MRDLAPFRTELLQRTPLQDAPPGADMGRLRGTQASARFPVKTEAKPAVERPAAATAGQPATLARQPALDAMRVPDPQRPIDPEAARAAVRNLDGVRSVAWMGPGELLVRVASENDRSQGMIDAACHAMEPLGDTLAVVVYVQNAGARDSEQMESISRNCRLQECELAFGQVRRPMEGLPRGLGEQYRDGKATPAQARRQRALADEAIKVIQARTPEM